MTKDKPLFSCKSRDVSNTRVSQRPELTIFTDVTRPTTATVSKYTKEKRSRTPALGS